MKAVLSTTAVPCAYNVQRPLPMYILYPSSTLHPFPASHIAKGIVWQSVAMWFTWCTCCTQAMRWSDHTSHHRALMPMWLFLATDPLFQCAVLYFGAGSRSDLLMVFQVLPAQDIVGGQHDHEPTSQSLVVVYHAFDLCWHFACSNGHTRNVLSRLFTVESRALAIFLGEGL